MPERAATRAVVWIWRVPRWLRTLLCYALGAALLRASVAGGWWGVGALLVMFGLVWLVMAVAEEAIDEAEEGRGRT